MRCIGSRAMALGMLLAFGLSGCASSQATPDETTLTDIYTSVAITLSAQPAPATAAPSLLAVASPGDALGALSPGSATPAATAYSTAYISPSGCNGSAYVRDVTVADGTELAPGDPFTKTWRITNTGTCSWSSTYYITFVSGSAMEGSDTAIGRSVAPGSTADVSVYLIAPNDEGKYTGYWSMANNSGTQFGQRVYVKIVVSVQDATDTPTPTSTATPTSESSTPTLTSIPDTATMTPTATPTATPESTATDEAGG